MSLDIFIGGGGDDLMPGGGVLRDYARRFAAETGRQVSYFPNARVARVVRAAREALQAGETVNLVGHSWGGPDAFRAVVALSRERLFASHLITLDPVAGPFRRPAGAVRPTRWIHVHATPPVPDRSDRLTGLPPLSRKPAALPTADADRTVDLAVNHWDVDRMMDLSGAREVLLGSGD